MSCCCVQGCNECCNDDACKQANQVMSKAGAGVIIMCLLGREKAVDVDALPWGDEDVEAGFDTVVEAVGVRMAGGVKRHGGRLPGEDGKGRLRGEGDGEGEGEEEEEEEGERMVRAKLVDGVWVKEEEEDEDHFSRSVHMFGGQRTFIGVHK